MQNIRMQADRMRELIPQEHSTLNGLLDNLRIMGPMLSYVKKNNLLKLEFREGQIFFAANLGNEIALQIYESGMSSLIRTWILSEIVASGPKVYRPSADVCELMGLTAPKITWADYQQPFQTMLIEWPESVKNSMRIRPYCTAITQAENNRGAIVCTFCSNGFFYTENLNPRSTSETIEFMLDNLGDTAPLGILDVNLDRSEREETAHLTKMAVNCNLLLVTLGSRNAGPSNPDFALKLDERIRNPKKGKEANEKNKLERRLIPDHIELEQHLLVGGDKNFESRVGHSIANHESPIPHWRMGHFRMQRIGAGRAQTRRVFIRPTLVNAHLLKEGQRISTYIETHD